MYTYIPNRHESEYRQEHDAAHACQQAQFSRREHAAAVYAPVFYILSALAALSVLFTGAAGAVPAGVLFLVAIYHNYQALHMREVIARKERLYQDSLQRAKDLDESERLLEWLHHNSSVLGYQEASSIIHRICQLSRGF